MPKGRLELPWGCPRRPLKTVCLPIPPLRQVSVRNLDYSATRAVGLYRELGWIYFHKLGDILDDFHPVYKKEWEGWSLLSRT